MPDAVNVICLVALFFLFRIFDATQQREWRHSQEELFRASMDMHQRTMTMVIRGAAGQLDPLPMPIHPEPHGIKVASTSPVDNDEEAELLMRAEAEIMGLKGVGAR